jgi:hypothetical protein
VKSLIPIILIIALALGLFVALDGIFQRGVALAKAKAEYAEYKRIAEADHEMSMRRVAALEAQSVQYVEEITTYQVKIESRDATIATLRGKVTTTNAENAKLRTEVQPVIDANPALAEFVASLDSAIVLLDALIVEQVEQINDLKIQGWLKDERFAVQVALTQEWMAAHERERALRIAAEDLFSLAERQLKLNKLWRTAAIVAGAAAVGAVIAK